MNANTETVILKTCSLLEKVRDIDPEFVFGEEVEESRIVILLLLIDF